MKQEHLTRRDFLQNSAALGAAAAAVTLAPEALALNGRNYHPDDADTYDFLLPRICNNNPDWDFAPAGDRNLLEQLSQVLRVKVKLIPGLHDRTPENGYPEHFNALVDLTDLDIMRQYPYLFMMGTGAYQIQPKNLENLKSWIEEGGFLLMDECASPRLRDEFYLSAHAALLQMFGEKQVRRIPEDHEVYKTVYDVSEPNFKRWKREAGQSAGNTGVFLGDRLAVFLCDADIHCGWTDERSSWTKRANHEESIKTGINIFAYALSH
jgi:hypothetical protein